MMMHYFRFVLATLLLCTMACRAADKAEVTFETTEMTIKDKKFTIEIADTQVRRERGLMHRDKMAADHGMIFIFDTPDNYKFWMKNTKIPLDLIFLDASGKVVGICDLKPLDETGVGCDAVSSYAIELNAGTAKNAALKVGDKITLPEKLLKNTKSSDDK